MTTQPITPSCVPPASSSSSRSSRSRPTPTRTLKQPDAFIVATSDDHGPPVRSDKESLRQSLEGKAELQRIALSWTERLIEDEPVDRSSFKQACQYVHLETYRSILHERHLSDQCAYPLCPNKSKKSYRSYVVPRSKIISGGPAGRRIIVQTGNDLEGFCSETCEKKSEWVIRSGLLRGESAGRGMDELGDDPVGIELLEEVEERLKRERDQALDQESKNQEEPSQPAEVSKTRPSERTTSPSSSSSIPQPTLVAPPRVLVDKIPSLTIYEHPTPLTPPLPPTLSPPSSPSVPTSSRPSSLHHNTTIAVSGNDVIKSPASIKAREALRRRLGGSDSLVPSSLVSSGMRTDLSAEIARGGRSMNFTSDETNDDDEVEVGGIDENGREEEVDDEEDSWRLMELAREELERMDIR
ncbi:Uncharacterized conserved protein [Phaffia rhodozyma]|uniref:RNA polymerase II subunit B1 CTD phosphatase RPAP2 homolog n=1 Tax=Phaffia rhodozyma TaxID=264483 RepID=A0A0F7SUI1_PHARH|nr:Uncharacterized conserved protein [Phaffia rhodozyma]